MTRLYAELIAGAVAIIAIAWLWIHHDNHEENLGAESCIQATTETKSAATLSKVEAEASTQVDLKKVVDSYDTKLNDMRAANSDLAQRLHDRNALHASAVPRLSQPAGFVCTPADDGKPTERDRLEAADLEACAANTIELIELRAAWEVAAKKKGQLSAP